MFVELCFLNSFVVGKELELWENMAILQESFPLAEIVRNCMHLYSIVLNCTYFPSCFIRRFGDCIHLYTIAYTIAYSCMQLQGIVCN